MKRSLALFLAVIMLFSAITVSAYSGGKFANGDVDMSGVVDVSDVTLIQKYLVRKSDLSNEQAVLADTDLNERNSIMDATVIQKDLAEIKDMPTDSKVPQPAVGKEISIYFSNNKNWSSVYFYLYNSKTNTAETQWPGRLITTYETNEMNEKIYTSTVDVSKYDRIIFNNNSQQTVNIPVNKSSSGFYISGGSSKALLVSTYAHTGSDSGKLTTTMLDYSTGYKKKIWIWTPADYSATSKEKYKTVYMCDGQNLFEDHSDGYGGWETSRAVENMMSNGGRGIILVGIDNGNAKRDSELTPDLGEPLQGYGDFSVRTGEEYANFVVNTVMPYVQKNYNSSDLSWDNIIAGSSSGGLEAFYIGMEHKDKFGGIGALSPAFILFKESDWNTYLSKFDLTAKDMPKLYIFNGKGDDLENVLYDGAELVYNKLKKGGYSEKDLTFVAEDSFAHNEAYWRLIYPEMLCWLLEL